MQILHRDYIQPCRQIQRELVRRRHHRSLVPIMDAAFSKSDANYARLTTYQVTWGQFIRVGEALEADLIVQLHRAQTVLDVEPPGSPVRR